MSKQKKPHQSKSSYVLFDPDEIATSISQALQLDLGSASHEYGVTGNPGLYGLHRQCVEHMKKFCPQEQDKERLEAETFEKFLQTNRHMETINRKLKDQLPEPGSRISRNSNIMDKIHLRARALCRFVLSPFEEQEWFTECRNSGGSSIGVPYSDTSMESKFRFPMSVTDGVQNIFYEAMAWDESLMEAVENFNSEYPVTEPFNVVSGSRATTVDKTAEKRRMICVEPTCNMYLQQGLMHMMYRRLKVVGLNVETLPDKHKVLARESSITGSNATIDWSSASDCLSIELLRWVLPPEWFDVVYLCRSHVTQLAGQEVSLNMMSTMGNATTFPLETLVFWAYAHATIMSQDPTTNSLYAGLDDMRSAEVFSAVSVFGDDCIVPSKLAPQIIEALTEVGFIINDEKSFYGTERFRESCGGDYFAGYDVRPFHLRAPHSTRMSALEPWLYTILNGLLPKYRMYFGDLTYVYDKALWRTMFELFRRYKINIKLVPSFFPEDAGAMISHDIVRFNNHYPLKLQRIRRNVHGTLMFNYLSFKYKVEREKHHGIRFAHWLRQPLITEQTLGWRPKGSAVRKIGGYVVAKGISCHWHVPVVRSVW